MNAVTSRSYTLQTPAMDAELLAYAAMRLQTLRQEYERLAVIAVAERTSWQSMRHQTLRSMLGINGSAA